MGYIENKKKYNIEYKKAKLKRVPLDLSLEKYEELKAHCRDRSEPINGFIKRAIDEQMRRDKSEE